jgi:lipoprotein-releasing system permease protein
MVPFSLFLALKYLRPKRSFISVVTVISVLGVLLGVAILVIVLSVMTGFDNMWRTKILSFKPHLTVYSRYGVVENDYEVARKAEAIPGIITAAPSIETRVLIQCAGRTAAPIVVGVDPDRAGRISRVPDHMETGVFRVDGEFTVIGRDLAQRIGAGPGSEILVYSPMNVIKRDELYLPEELVVAGVFNLGMRDFDSSFILTSIQVARELVGMDSGAHSVYVMTEDAFRFEEFAGKLRSVLGPSYSVRTWKEVDRLMFEALSHEKALMAVLLGIITVVAVFCVTNTLIVITYQKTNEIGLLKALGIPSWRIMLAFVLHGWIQCVVGISLGIGTGYLVLDNLAGLATALTRINVNAFPKEIYGLSRIPWTWDWGDIGFISLFVMGFCTLVSLIPAGRAVWLDPVAALRHE